MPESFDQLKRLYFTLDTNLERLLAACSTEEQKQTLRNSYTEARHAFQAARERTFDQYDAQVVRLTTQLNTAVTVLERMLKNLGKISSLISKAAEAAGIAGKLIAAATKVV